MKDETVAQLNAVNRRFYRERASEFSTTRERPWPGWEELMDRHRRLLPRTPSVLDVGCGNGRFARFLENRLADGFRYTGVDASRLALDEARRRLSEGVALLEHDFVVSADPLPPALTERKFDLVVLFGVLHHFPGRSRRLHLLTRLSEKLAEGGLLAYTVWLFLQEERFRKKLVPWPEFVTESKLEIDLGELEPGDYIMTWGGDPPSLALRRGLAEARRAEAGPPAFRYCHAMSEEEEDWLRSSLPLEVVSRFEPRGELNRYWVFRR